MQNQFNGIISKLYHQFNDQLQSMTNMLQQSQQKEGLRIKMLEKQVYSLNLEKNKQKDDINKMQQKIEKMKGSLCDDKISQNERIKIWLTENVRLPIYYDLLINNGYDDMESIRDITDNDLLQIGVDKIGHRKKIIKHAQQIMIKITSSIRKKKPYHTPNKSNSLSPTPIPWTCWNCRCYNIATSMQCTLCGHSNKSTHNLHNDSV